MKKLFVVISALALSSGLASVVNASQYVIPESIECEMSKMGQLSCGYFDKGYLAEHTHTANFEPGKSKVLDFAKATAYFTPSENQWSILFTYKDAKAKNVTLKTIDYSTRPDLKQGAWRRVKDEFYECDGAVKTCAITNRSTPSNVG